MPEPTLLTLEDGTAFQGLAFGMETLSAGEVVFNTGMVGYPEALTDPSYRGQILVLTYPLIGNYGVPAFTRDKYGLPVGFESDRIQVAGLVVSESALRYSHYTATRSLHQWLLDEGIPGICGIDTRALTKRLRDRGTMLGKIETGQKTAEFFDPNATNLVASVTAGHFVGIEADPTPQDGPTPSVVVVDCGCKANIQRSLLIRGINLTRVPHDHDFLGMEFDGILISSGPGDPKMCTSAISNVKRALTVGKPILGICLGHQILALAAGGDTYKLKFGHRGQNQPCVERNGSDLAADHGRAVITTQNHGFAVRDRGLPVDWEIWFSNVNDGSVEGIRHRTEPFWGVQFHPEANPGPVDTSWVFDRFCDRVKQEARGSR